MHSCTQNNRISALKNLISSDVFESFSNITTDTVHEVQKWKADKSFVMTSITVPLIIYFMYYGSQSKKWYGAGFQRHFHQFNTHSL